MLSVIKQSCVVHTEAPWSCAYALLYEIKHIGSQVHQQSTNLPLQSKVSCTLTYILLQACVSACFVPATIVYLMLTPLLHTQPGSGAEWTLSQQFCMWSLHTESWSHGVSSITVWSYRGSNTAVAVNSATQNPFTTVMTSFGGRIYLHSSCKIHQWPMCVSVLYISL